MRRGSIYRRLRWKMNSREMKRRIKKARQSGLSNLDIMRIKEASVKAAREVELEAQLKAFYNSILIPCNVLANDYWSKTAKKRIPEFIDDCVKLWNAVEEGVVKKEELEELVYDFARIRITEEGLVRDGD